MQFIVLNIFILLLSSNSFETIRKEKVDIDKFDKYMLIIIDGVYCHDCLIKLSKIVEQNSKVKTIVAFKKRSNIIENKLSIKNCEKYIKPDLWLFYEENNMFSNFDINISPNIILKNKNKYYEFHYKDLFIKKKKDLTLNKLYNLYLEISHE